MKPKAIVCDLDKTLCLIGNRDPYDASDCESDIPNVPVVKTLEAMSNDGYEIIFVSGRKIKFIEPTISWLKKHLSQRIVANLHPRLFMRDNKDQRADHLIKKEIYLNKIEPNWDILLVIDDRPSVVRMWRCELNLTVFQVNDKEF